MSIKSEIRISRYLAKAGLASRREAEKLILDGRVTLNGETVFELWRNCANTDVLKLDGTVVSQSMPTALYQLHKPVGYLSTSKDAMGRKTIFDLIDSKLDHLMIIGRLDYNSEGLIILTNNGGLKRYLELPKNRVERIYNVKIKGHLTTSNLAKIKKGLSFGPFSLGNLKTGKSKKLKLENYTTLKNYWT